MAGLSHSRFTAEMVREMLHEEQDEEDKSILILSLTYLMLMTMCHRVKLEFWACLGLQLS